VNYFQGLPASDIPASDTKDVEEEPRPRRIRGMQDSSFWLLIGLICALVIGVSVGGAVGGSMAVAKKNDQAHNDPTTTVTQCVRYVYHLIVEREDCRDLHNANGFQYYDPFVDTVLLPLAITDSRRDYKSVQQLRQWNQL
jgi:hypothetical protein